MANGRRRIWKRRHGEAESSSGGASERGAAPLTPTPGSDSPAAAELAGPPPTRQQRSYADRLCSLWIFTRLVVERFIDDRCFTGAGALSYTTLLSLVPLTAIVLAVLSVFPIFADVRDQLLTMLFANFVPQVGGEVEWWFRYFAGTAVKTTAIGVVALAVTAILLLVTVEEQLDQIWHVRASRPWIQRILAYWAVLSLGPLLLGASLSLWSYLDIIARDTGLDRATSVVVEHGWSHGLARLLPPLLETVAFTLLYRVIPNCVVRWRDGLVGAVVAAVLSELLKVGFALYIDRFASYRVVYGALATIPIFLVWMYVSWGAVLFGGVVAAELPRWRIDGPAPLEAEAGRRLGLALALLGELARRVRGAIPDAAGLAAQLGVAATAVEEHLKLLQGAGLVAATTTGGWLLARDLGATTLHELYAALDIPVVARWRRGPEAPWQPRIAGAMDRVVGAEAQLLNMPLAELIPGGAGGNRGPSPRGGLRRRLGLTR